MLIARQWTGEQQAHSRLEYQWNCLRSVVTGALDRGRRVRSFDLDHGPYSRISVEDGLDRVAMAPNQQKLTEGGTGDGQFLIGHSETGDVALRERIAARASHRDCQVALFLEISERSRFTRSIRVFPGQGFGTVVVAWASPGLSRRGIPGGGSGQRHPAWTLYSWPATNRKEPTVNSLRLRSRSSRLTMVPDRVDGTATSAFASICDENRPKDGKASDADPDRSRGTC
jgi:hypothetical protein